MKISLGMNLQEGPWGGGNQFGKALLQYLRIKNAEISFSLDDPDLDVILLVEPRAEMQISAYTDREIRWYRQHVNPNAIVVHRINECDERKGTQGLNKRLIAANKPADHTVFISGWLRDLFLEQGIKTPAHSVIWNGAEKRIFHPLGYHPWNGSGQLKLVTHHWGTNWRKGYDIYQQLDEMLGQSEWRERLAFTYIGQPRPDFAFKNTAYIAPLTGEALANALRSHHIYFTASQNEPAGMHHIEGALCGLPLLFRESGALPEYCEGYGVSFNEENFVVRLEKMISEYDFWRAKMHLYDNSAQKMCENYYNLFVDLVSQRDAVKARRPVEQLSAPPLSDDDRTWLDALPDNMDRFVRSLAEPETPGRFYPAYNNLTEAGEGIELAFSCFALKIYYMLGLWDELLPGEQSAWLDYIRSFQVEGNPVGIWTAENAFIDPVLLQWVRWQVPRRRHLLDRLFFPKRMTVVQRMISGETKQAVATLAQVGAATVHPYTGFPTHPAEMLNYLSHLDWTQPWEAGAHTATIAVYLRTEGPRFLGESRIAELLTICVDFINSLADPKTGAYFRGGTPSYEQRVNGAMKVLTALAWLEIPIHHPEALIDTCLMRLPDAEGCHLVDAVYVLHRCLEQADHRKDEVQEFCRELVSIVRAHHNEDGGFSYFAGRAQSHIHRVRITKGPPISDIHGSVLLTWAVVMMLDILEENTFGWRVMKP